MRKHGALAVAVASILLAAFPLLANPISMGPQAMEGNLKVSPGTILRAGYDFTIPGAHPEIDVAFDNAKVVFQAECVGGGSAGPIFVPLSGGLTTVPKNSSAWYPSGDQHSPAVYQGAVVVPDLCGGGEMTLKSGGTFTADLTASDTTRNVHVRWHYSANGSSGSWSGTASFEPGPLGGVV
jgi:hypothetical protein